MNYCTTIEQSKRLLELGLDPKTSDCNWQHAPGYENYEGEITGFWDEPEWGQSGDSKDLPCWSLGALLELMPKIKEDDDDGGCYPTLCKGYNTDKWHCVYRSSIYITDWYDNPIDAVFEMIVWLLENGYIKTEKEMTQEEKRLLLVDLCARLPYKVQVFVEHDKYAQATLLGVNVKQFSIVFGGNNWSSTSNIEGHHIEQYKQLIKPYLRSMSSMTDEEREDFSKPAVELELKSLESEANGPSVISLASSAYQIDWLIKHHFDYRGLIEKGLALPAPKDMYKDE